MNKSINFFKSIFDDFPNLAILHIDNNVEFIKSTIEEIVNNSDGKLKYRKFDENFCKKVSMIGSREFEYIILSDILTKCEDKIKVLNSCYTALENSAQIIVMEKKGNLDPFTIKNLLDEVDFRAVNEIDIFDEYTLVMGKKMHMWGNGL